MTFPLHVWLVGSCVIPNSIFGEVVLKRVERERVIRSHGSCGMGNGNNIVQYLISSIMPASNLFTEPDSIPCDLCCAASYQYYSSFGIKQP